METNQSHPQQEDTLSCPGCQAKDPETLPCGHHLCRNCLLLCQQELGPQGCTVCYGRDVLDDVLKGLLDALFKGQPRRDAPEPKDICSLHGEKIILFCLKDEEPICSLCQEGEHQEHECCSAEEALDDCKKELKAALKPLQEKLQSLNNYKQNCDVISEHIKKQTQQTEKVIKEEFKKLHKFLRDEEVAMVAALKEEEEQKSAKVVENIEKVEAEISSLTEAVKLLEEEIDVDDISLLKTFKTSMQRAQCSAREPEEEEDGLIDEANNIGCLKYRIWEKMQGLVQYTPVTLDPNTADACLSVSEDLTTLRYLEEDQQLPNNPERFNYYECVLGSEGFSSGRHSWDVEVGDNSEWAVGVVKETVERKEWFPPSPERGLWSICLCGGEYQARMPVVTTLRPKKKPQKVRVQLDWDCGRVTFSDAGDNTVLYKFKHRFTETIYPYFSSTCKRHPLRILPGRVSVTVE